MDLGLFLYVIWFPRHDAIELSEFRLGWVSMGYVVDESGCDNGKKEREIENDLQNL